MKSFSVKMAEFHYCITSPDGTDGPIVPYGERATLDYGEDIYTCIVVDADDAHPEVFRVDEVTLTPAEVDEVIFPEDITKALQAVATAIEAHAGTNGEDTTTIEATAEKLN